MHLTFPRATESELRRSLRSVLDAGLRPPDPAVMMLNGELLERAWRMIRAERKQHERERAAVSGQ